MTRLAIFCTLCAKNAANLVTLPVLSLLSLLRDLKLSITFFFGLEVGGGKVVLLLEPPEEEEEEKGEMKSEFEFVLLRHGSKGRIDLDPAAGSGLLPTSK